MIIDLAEVIQIHEHLSSNQNLFLHMYKDEVFVHEDNNFSWFTHTKFLRDYSVLEP
jgi:hypothetical protein